MSLRRQNEVQYLIVTNNGDRLSIIGETKHINDLNLFLRSEGLHPIVDRQVGGGQDMLEFEIAENDESHSALSEQKLSALLDQWKTNYADRNA